MNRPFESWTMAERPRSERANLRLQGLASGGDGPNVVVFPCAGGNATSYGAFARHLAAKATAGGPLGSISALECLPFSGEESPDAYALDQRIEQSVETLAQQLGGPLILVGHSFGGYLAHQIAARLAAEKTDVAAIVVLASPPPSAIEPIARIAGDAAASQRFIDQFGVIPEAVRRSDLFTQVYLPFIRYELKLFAASVERKSQRFWGPALVVATPTDVIASPSISRGWTDWAAAVRHVSVPGDHFFPVKQPAPLAATISAFLNEHAIPGERHADA